MNKCYIGIDNGVSGAIAGVKDSNVSVVKTPIKKIGDKKYIDSLALKLIIQSAIYKYGEVHCILETGQINPLFGAKGNYATGYSFGVVVTLLEIMAVPFTLVNPKTWQSIMFKDLRLGPNKDTKGASIEMCKRLYPEINLLPTSKCTKEDDGLADAVMIATYGKRIGL